MLGAQVTRCKSGTISGITAETDMYPIKDQATFAQKRYGVR
jgi:hypothetical protein